MAAPSVIRVSSLRRRRFLRMIAPGPLLLLGGCFATAGLPIREGLAGSVHVEAPGASPATLTPVRCESGERQVFLGADFVDTADKVVRLIVSATGASTVRVFDGAHPLDTGTLFHRADCTRFELTLDRTGWRVNDVYDLAVRFAFDCRTAAGEHAAGELAAEHCH